MVSSLSYSESVSPSLVPASKQASQWRSLSETFERRSIVASPKGCLPLRALREAINLDRHRHLHWHEHTC